ncbi:50S ribosomal protein L10 [Candidatus Shapirobacteria bacterium CG06_land_8_20_14_3_00_40_12]|uniref:Large ribosomal subunit protein uL10 n=2 Tax=Candidatus Shapironibacteriota TaxID=1752721 RepID=A0A2M7TTD5_9BACT|nr:MAG: 50S ribosomal protein L10 [Candidatus Shapirobacteria bacterium CG06_land_8_20_14_3_00_40_12]PIZ58834.1 MAG: 50S ribosomal protein L10 [Candidatus Shapirobacteria bacterium CG_4_10_14_0_2_um_filter_40_12]
MKNKTIKIDKVEAIAKRLNGSKSAALLQYQGLSAGDISTLRDKVKTAGGQVEVIKNSLISRALEKIGIKLPEILTGPTAITFCDTDEIAPLKEIDAVNKSKEKTTFKYGIYGGKLLLIDELKKFLSLPSKSALISQLLGGLKNPLQRLAYAMRYNQTQLVLTLKALADKNK